MEISRADLYPTAVLDTLTQAEMGIEPDKIERAATKGWLNPFTLKDVHRLVYLRVGENTVVKGWLSTRFRCAPRTFWTWDARFACELPFGGTMPGYVEPVGWCEIGE